MSYADVLLADRRLVILRLLVEDDGCANESILEKGLFALGHRRLVDRAFVRDQLKFLEEADLLTLERFKDRVLVATITDLGRKVTQGYFTVDGVAKPS